MTLSTKMECAECNRTFDMFDEGQAEEWFFGHDCEGKGK